MIPGTKKQKCDCAVQQKKYNQLIRISVNIDISDSNSQQAAATTTNASSYEKHLGGGIIISYYYYYLTTEIYLPGVTPQINGLNFCAKKKFELED